MEEVNYFEILQPMFPNRTDDQLRNIIEIVIEAEPNNSFDQTIENMVNLLTGDGAQGPMPNIFTTNPQRMNQFEEEMFQNNEQKCDELYENLLNFFKDICPDFLRKYCRDKPPEFLFENAIDEFSISKYCELRKCYTCYIKHTQIIEAMLTSVFLIFSF